MACVGSCNSSPCGIAVAILRLYGWAPVRAAAMAYVEFFRNLPLILVVFWAFYVVPILTGLGLPPLQHAHSVVR